MDTSYEEPGLSSQYDEFSTSPCETENKLNLEVSPSSNIPANNVNSNVLSPFSSLTSRIVTPNPSVPVKHFQEESIQSEHSDLEEECSGVERSVAQSARNNPHETHINQVDTAIFPENGSQGSSSAFSGNIAVST
jgi:hypothetical protein